MSIPVSLVITTYNREQYLGAAIASVLAQTYPHFELVVWDDGSTDNSLAIARGYAERDRRVRVVAAPHQGRMLSLKMALACTEGTYLGWVDSDDLLAPTALAETVGVLAAQPAMGWVYTDYVDIDAGGQPLGYGHRCQMPYSPERLLVDLMTFHFRLMRRSAFEQVGGIDLALEQCEDYDISLRLSEKAQVAHIAQPLYLYRHHTQSMSNQARQRQLYWSQVAIQRALDRRGLSDRLQISFEGDRFILRSRKPKLATWRACIPHLMPRPVGTVLASLSLFGLVAREAQALVAPTPGQLKQGTVTTQPRAVPQPSATAARTAIPDLPEPQPRFAEIPPLTLQLAQAIQPASDGTGTVVNQSGNQFDITGGQQSGDRTNLFHIFEQFNLSAEQTATFLSQPEIQNIVGRIVGGDPSLLNGLLQVVGGPSNLFLVNPAGLLVGPNIQLDIPGSLTLTSANAIGFGDRWWQIDTPVDFSLLNGAPTGFTFLADSPSPVVNTGNLTVRPGQAVRLMGGTVVNTGTITAPGGEITLAALPGSNTVRISQPGQLLSLEVESTALQSLAAGGSLPVTALPTLLTGSLLTPGLAVNPLGQAMLTATGTVILPGQMAAVSGQLDASSPDGVGGTVAVLGDRVGLFNATLDASGETGGGQMFIGGGYQGQGPVPNANRTIVNGGTTLAANALTTGDGGQIFVWADGATSFLGDLEIRGGAESGNGGFAEVSGLEFLDYRGRVDAQAAHGMLGTLLLDPTNIEVVGSGYGTFNLSLVDDFSDPDLDPVNRRTLLEVSAINSASANVVLQATNDITFNAEVAMVGSGYGLSVTAGNRIDVNQGIRLNGGDFVANSAVFDASGITIATQGGGISITTTGGNLTTGDLDTSVVAEGSGYSVGSGNGGAVVLNSAGNLSTGAILTFAESQNIGDSVTATAGQGGNVDLRAGGAVTVNGGIQTSSRATAIDEGSFLFLTAIANAEGGGDVSIVAGGDLTVNGAIDTTAVANALDEFAGLATATAGPGGSVNLQAGNRLTTAAIDTFSEATAQSDPFSIFAPIATARAGDGGRIATQAGELMTLGRLNTTSTARAIATTATATATAAQGGATTLQSTGDIQLESINTQSEAEAVGSNAQIAGQGIGGTVDITTDRFFRATGTFIDQNGIAASISTAGGEGGGPITIRHGGGRLGTPFTVGATVSGPTGNGTAGAITTGTDNTIDSGSFPETYAQGADPSIQIITQPRPQPPEYNDEDLLIQIQGEPPPTAPITEALQAQTQAPIKELAEARDILRQVENATGIKPALVYVQFIPARIGAETPGTASPEVETLGADPNNNFVQRETLHTQQFESHLALPSTSTSAPVTGRADTDQLELMVITADGPALWKRVNVSRAEMLATAQRFRLEVADPRKIWTRSYEPSAQQLYQWVIDPIQRELQSQGIGNLTFVADSGLRSIPWAALHNGQQFLIETYSVGLMPSLSLADTRFVDIRNAQVLAAGASEFATQAALPAVPTELALLDTIWQGRVLPEDQFTFDSLRQQRQQTPYGIVHLATHGEFQPGRPENSFIQLKDTRLQLDQMRQMGWSNPPLELLVLSACRTALGDEEAELGFAGLALQAGVKSALASLWYVSDVGTLALMTEFYRQLQTAPQATLKAEALRQSQLQLLRGEVKIQDGSLYLPDQAEGIVLGPDLSGTDTLSLSHPFYWAAFTMSGNPW